MVAIPDRPIWLDRNIQKNVLVIVVIVHNWLVVYLPLRKIWIRQLGWLFPTEWKVIKDVPNHQPAIYWQKGGNQPERHDSPSVFPHVPAPSAWGGPLEACFSSRRPPGNMKLWMGMNGLSMAYHLESGRSSQISYMATWFPRILNDIGMILAYIGQLLYIVILTGTYLFAGVCLGFFFWQHTHIQILI